MEWKCTMTYQTYDWDIPVERVWHYFDDNGLSHGHIVINVEEGVFKAYYNQCGYLGEYDILDHAKQAVETELKRQD